MNADVDYADTHGTVLAFDLGLKRTGVASGELTRREARRMNRQQAAVNQAEDKAKADGTVTAQERRRLTKAQNQTSKNIYRQKHDAQERPASAPKP